MFLPSGWFTPVLPPTDESTCAMTVVGTFVGQDNTCIHVNDGIMIHT